LFCDANAAAIPLCPHFSAPSTAETMIDGMKPDVAQLQIGDPPPIALPVHG
jgi:hypothetical protein